MTSALFQKAVTSRIQQAVPKPTSQVIRLLRSSAAGRPVHHSRRGPRNTKSLLAIVCALGSPSARAYAASMAPATATFAAVSPPLSSTSSPQVTVARSLCMQCMHGCRASVVLQFHFLEAALTCRLGQFLVRLDWRDDDMLPLAIHRVVSGAWRTTSTSISRTRS